MTSSEKRKYLELLKLSGWVDGGPEDENRKAEARADLEWQRWKCVTDLYYLGTEVLGLKKVKRRVWPKFHRWLCSVISMAGDKMILVPRKHAKTTWIEARIVQLILAHGGRVRILMLARTERLVTSSLAAIKRKLSTPALQVLFPDVAVEPGKDYKNWAKSTTNELKIREYADYLPKEPQILALGSAAAFTGFAVDYIFMDDYIDDETCQSPTLMQKAEEDWRYLQPILDDGGEICITGTFYHYSDLYNFIIKEKHFAADRVFIRKAIENGNIIYPSIFTQKRLDDLQRRLGNYVFSCQFLLNPIPREDQIFPPPQPVIQTLPKGKYRYYILMDPAPTTKSYSNSTGAVVAAVDRLKRVFFVEAVKFKKDGAGKADWLIRKCLQYEPSGIGIEYGLQTDLDFIIKQKVSEYEKAAGKRVPMPVITPIKISNRQSKGERIYRTLGSFVRDGKVFIVEPACGDLIHQMNFFTGFGNEEDDVVDAASFLFPLVKEFGFSGSLLDNLVADTSSFFGKFKKKSDNSWRAQFAS